MGTVSKAKKKPAKRKGIQRTTKTRSAPRVRKPSKAISKVKKPAKRKVTPKKAKARSVPRARKPVKALSKVKKPAKRKVTPKKAKTRPVPRARKAAKAVSGAKKKPAKRKGAQRKTRAQAIPSEHKALESVIRGIQKSYKNPIPESRFAQHIQRVAGVVAQAITAADQLMVACQIPSIELVSRMVIMDKDQKSGRMGTEKDLNRVLIRLGATPLGKEGLYRVVHAISSSVVQDLLPLSSSASLKEVQRAAFMFAAQPLLQELLQEEGFRS